ncbi:aldolase/citrate lyase family protein [Marinovum sp. 2_MG-2023]|uniref:HpcH/HpaI aldolase family protein n=1 Tax=unclassified Marinovum TaxID=2647166 RepID=UPI0026E246F8|nr:MULTISPECIES: aldolase/citrate lyase family protein [unclassified Marinovum]MDO6732540.1 aldolase/citrate lyase family protein [Marinovum sp. 2_MG-2023]MDO6781828.1 aldolase/citrate lyase family protein [Marinovum sp. 1_MG-2023]
MTDSLPRTLEKGRIFKKKLTDGQAVSGAWSTLGSPEAACLMAGAGLDYLLIDLEHGRGGLDGLAAQVQALAAFDTAVMVRLPDHESGSIKRCLDLGANCILAPQVDTAAMAQSILDAALFPTEGRRGVAVGAIQAADWGYSAESYFAHANDALTVLVQIESPEAVANLDDILALKRLDGVFVGPNDLSANMGLFRQFDAPPFRAAFDTVLQSTLAAGKVFGALPAPNIEVEALVKRGAQVVPAGSDQAMLRGGTQAMIAGLKAAGDKA